MPRTGERLGWTVVDVYCDNDLSAFSGRRRPAYERMLSDIDAGNVDAVIAWHPDRLHRRAAELERYIGVCEKHRVEEPDGDGGHVGLVDACGPDVGATVGCCRRVRE